MKDQGTITLGALAGAVAGGIFAYLFFTEPGRRLKRDLEPHVTELVAEISRARVWPAGATARRLKFPRPSLNPSYARSVCAAP